MNHDKDEVVLRVIHKIDSQLQSLIARNRGAWFEPHVNSLHIECKKVMTIIRNGPPSSDQNAAMGPHGAIASTNSQDLPSQPHLARKTRAPRVLEETPSILPSLPHRLRIKNPNARNPNGRPHLAFGSIVDAQQSKPPQRKGPAPASLPALSAGLEKGKPVTQFSAQDPSPAHPRSELQHTPAIKENIPISPEKAAPTAPKANEASDLSPSTIPSTPSPPSSSKPPSSAVVAGPTASAGSNTPTPISSLEAGGVSSTHAGVQGTHRAHAEKVHVPTAVTSTTSSCKPVIYMPSKVGDTPSEQSAAPTRTPPKTAPMAPTTPSSAHVASTTVAVPAGDVSVAATVAANGLASADTHISAAPANTTRVSDAASTSGGVATTGSSAAEGSSLASHGQSLSLLVVDSIGNSPSPAAASSKAPDSTTHASASPTFSMRSVPAGDEAAAPEAACSPRAAGARREVSLSDAVHALMRKHSVVEDGALPTSPSGRSHSVLDGDAAGLRSQRSPAAGQNKPKLNSPLAGARGFPSSRTNGDEDGITPTSGAVAGPRQRLGSGAPRRASMPGLHSLGRKGRKGSVTSEILSLAGVFLDTSAGDGEEPEQKKIVLPKHSKEDWIKAMNELPEEEDDEEEAVDGEAADV